MSPRDWNASSYDAISAPQQAWGERVVARLELRGDEVVLDAGCGSGRVTEMVLARLPRGRVIAVDGSESMAALARERLDPERVTVLCADLSKLYVDEPVDAVISTATFHWILDHDILFSRIREVLEPGGQFVAQCGGVGNIARVRAAGGLFAAVDPYASYIGDIGQIWNYAGVAETRERLERAGFAVTRCWLEDAPVSPERPREFLETVIFAPYLEHLPPQLREPFLDGVMEELGERPELDYVRLNWDAVASA